MALLFYAYSNPLHSSPVNTLTDFETDDMHAQKLHSIGLRPGRLT
jgi:hypothetical protein